MYHIGQLVEGVISRVESFGAFVSLDPGIEALLHVSQMSRNPEENPLRHLYEGQKLLMRIISIESEKQRLGLSLTEVTATELQQWEERQMELVAQARAAAAAQAEAERDEQEGPFAAIPHGIWTVKPESALTIEAQVGSGTISLGIVSMGTGRETRYSIRPVSHVNSQC